MSVVVNPHNDQEEHALLAFLDNLNYDYSQDKEAFFLSEEQQQEILERDRLYEAGEMESYTLSEIIAHFDSMKK